MSHKKYYFLNKPFDYKSKKKDTSLSVTLFVYYRGT